MFRSTLFRRSVVALIMALMLGGVFGVQEIVIDDTRVSEAFAFSTSVHARQANCISNGSHTYCSDPWALAPSPRREGGRGLWGWIKEIGWVMGWVCRFVDWDWC